MGQIAIPSTGGGNNKLTWLRIANGFSTPLPTSGSFTVGPGNGMMYFNLQFKTIKVKQVYGSFVLIKKDGTRKSLNGAYDNNWYTTDISDCIALINTGSLGTGYTNFISSYQLS